MEVKNKLHLYILAQSADAGPPLGTILGNIAVNSTNFCKEFNTLTSDLPSYLTLSVKIEVFNNKSFKITINNLPLGKLIQLFKYEKTSIIQGKELTMTCINLKDIVQLAKFKMPKLPLTQAIPIILGVIRSCNLQIVY